MDDNSTVISCQLEPKPTVDHSPDDGNPSYPAMDVRKDALFTRLPEISVLEDAHGWLEEDEGECDEESDHDVSVYRVSVEVEVICHSEAETHATAMLSICSTISVDRCPNLPYHHDETDDLNGDMEPQNAILEIGVPKPWCGISGQVDRDCA